MSTRSTGPQPAPHEVRRIEHVTLVAGGEQTVFAVSPKPFAYRRGMRVRIDIIGGQAFVAEIP